MNDFENALAAALRSAAPAAPREIDPTERTRSKRRRWPRRTVASPLVTALVVATVVVTVFVATHTRRGRSHVAAPPLVGGEITAGERALAVRIATSEAAMSMPSANASAPSTSTSSASGWPWYVDRVSAIVTTHAAAMQYVGAAGADATRVLVIRLVGSFSWITTGPPGHGRATGNVITIVADVRTGVVEDAGIEQQKPPHSLPHATLLYAR